MQVQDKVTAMGSFILYVGKIELQNLNAITSSILIQLPTSDMQAIILNCFMKNVMLNLTNHWMQPIRLIVNNCRIIWIARSFILH